MVQEAASICITDYSSGLLKTSQWNIHNFLKNKVAFFHILFSLFKQARADRLDYEKSP